MKYPNAWIERAYFDGRPARRFDDARVEIEARTIVVEWRDGEQTFRYQGARNGQGHFLLHGEDRQDNATLHRFEHSVILEGFWKHHGDSGFWRIHLPETGVEEIIRVPKPVAAATRRRRTARRVRAGA